MLERHPQYVGFAHRAPALEGQERDALAPHLSDRVGPREIGALDGHPFRLPSEVVEDLDGLVGYADLVRVRKSQHHANFSKAPGESGTGPGFFAYQSGGLTDPRKDFLEAKLDRRLGQRFRERARATSLLVAAGAPFS